MESGEAGVGMQSYRLRNYLEVCHIIIHHEVGEADFMRFFDISHYKYKADLGCMLEMAPNYGIRIYVENPFEAVLPLQFP